MRVPDILKQNPKIWYIARLHDSIVKHLSYSSSIYILKLEKNKASLSYRFLKINYMNHGAPHVLCRNAAPLRKPKRRQDSDIYVLSFTSSYCKSNRRIPFCCPAPMQYPSETLEFVVTDSSKPKNNNACSWHPNFITSHFKGSINRLARWVTNSKRMLLE